MKVLLSWMREFAPFDQPPEELGAMLSDLGLTLEELRPVGRGLEGIAVARVIGLRSHPDADRIQLVDVDAGDGEALQVCCGAFNMAVGDKVPLASVGTVMPNGMTITKRKLRGQTSDGMLCSAAELGLGDDAEGILILPPDVSPGTPLADALSIGPDTLFDLEVNANRPDAMSVAGVARDLAARLGLPFRLPEATYAEVDDARAEDLVSVTIDAPDGCGRFTAKVLRNVHIGAAPPWMASRLTLLGMRPINALVDISNYVMLELGQPNHPYDLDRVPGSGLRVRWARDGERLVTLDDVERTFVPDDLLICDGDDQPVGIAGVMGGASAEIDADTTTVLLENAWFQPLTVARTARRHTLRTEASARFDKGCDPEAIDRAVARFCQLAQEICGAEVVAGMVDVTGSLPQPATVRVRPTRVNELLGAELSAEQMRSYLDPIGFTTKPAGDELDVDIPTWRLDSSTEIDVVEEIARMHGYERITKTVPPAVRFGRLSRRQRERRQLRRVLMGLGVAEAMPLPFLAPDDLDKAALDDRAIALLNPLVADESVLRPSLLIGLLKALGYNARHRNAGVGLWEIGQVFGPPPNGQLLPDEREHLAVVRAGRDGTATVDVWHVLVEALAVEQPAIANRPVPGLHPGRSARVWASGVEVGVLGEIDPEVAAAFGVEERVAALELDLGLLLDQPHGGRQYRPISRFPTADIDLAFETDDDVPATSVADTLADAGGDLVQSVELFDVYHGDQVGPDRRSLAFRIRFGALDHTLTDDEVAQARQTLIEAVHAAHGATLRA